MRTLNAGIFSTHTIEKPSKIFIITFAILPFYQEKKILKLIGHPEYFGIIILLLMKQSDVL